MSGIVRFTIFLKELVFQRFYPLVITFILPICFLSFPSNKVFARQESGAINSICNDSACIDRLLKNAGSLLQESNDAAKNMFLIAWRNSAAIKYKNGIARSVSGLAIYNIRHGDYQKAINLLLKGVEFARANHLDIIEGQMRNSLGVAYEHRGMFASGILHFYKTLDLLDTVKGAAALKIRVYSNLGGFWLRLDEEKQALKELITARSLLRDDTSSPDYPYILINTGVAYAKLQPDSAMLYFQKSLNFARLRGDRLLEEKSLVNIGLLYHGTSISDKGLAYFNQAYDIAAELNTPEAWCVAEIALGGALLELKRYKEAKPYFISTLERLKKEPIKEFVLSAHTSLAKLYAGLGHFEYAYQHQQMANAMADSTKKAEKGKTVDLLMQYRMAEKDKEISQKQAMLTIQQSMLDKKNTWLSIFIAGLIVTCILFFSFYRIHVHRKKLYDQQLFALTQEEEIGRLRAGNSGEERERSRIARELHDGIMVQFSAVKMHLSVLKDHHTDLKTSDSYRQAMFQLENATKELRQIAHTLMPDMLLAEGLGQAIAYFCTTLSNIKGLRTSFQQYGDIPRFYMDFEISLYRIVQELLQNVIKHANAKNVLVQLNLHGDMLCLTVEDDGIGMDAEKKQKDGLGLRSIYNRVKSLNGQLDISSSTNTGTTIYMEFGIADYIKKENHETC